MLYVEDDPGSRKVISMVARMNSERYDMTIYENSVAFEERFLNLPKKPDIVLLDIHVEPYSGFEMLAIIRQHPEYDDIPVVALTASVMNEEIEMLQEAGFQGVVSKPLNLTEFPTLIDRIMAGEHIWYVW
jgi:CheY-like chemotaxis protein